MVTETRREKRYLNSAYKNKLFTARHYTKYTRKHAMITNHNITLAKEDFNRKLLYIVIS